MTARGRPTAPAVIPSHWRGPLPNPTLQQHLNTDDDSEHGRGWTAVPAALLHGGFPDLGILVWTQLRLWSDDDERITNYQAIAKKLGVDSGSPSAIKGKVSAAIQPLLGTWIRRRRLTKNQVTYQAVKPDRRDRYAVIRRRDLGLISATKSTPMPVKPADIADFCRWQLECGNRGWTAETTTAIAAQWRVTPHTVRASRKRLADLGLLKVTHRERRLSEITWLEELFDPHWAVPLEPSSSPASPHDDEAKTLSPTSPGSGKNPVPHEVKDLSPMRKKTCPPIKDLTEVLTEDLSELGGTSVPALTSLPRELVDAPPPASSSEEHITGVEPADHRHTAARLIDRHRVLAAAKPHFRTAMVKRLTAALEQGLAPGHADRAIGLVAEDGLFDAECLLLKQALQHAWIAQRVGMCADCGDRGRHSPGCSQFDFFWDDDTTSVDRRDEAPDSSSPSLGAASDPIALLLQRPIADDPDELSADAEIVDWMTVQLARQIAEASDGAAMLRTVWARWRSKLKPEQRQLLDLANEHVHYALDLRRVS